MLAGEDFLRKLLELNPRERMTPKDARDHVWLAAQAAKEQVRSIEGELSRRSLASQTPSVKPKKQKRPRPLPPELSDCDERPSRAGTKRKASVLRLGRTLSTLSVTDTDQAQPPAKRARADVTVAEDENAGSAETIVPGLYRPTPPPRVVWTTESLDGEEIPGLGMWRDSSNGL